MKYWISVATQEHIRRGQTNSFLQIGHGKRGPLSRIKENDWVIFYAPKISLSDKTIVESFIAMGYAADSLINQEKVSDEYQPYRRKFHYVPVTTTDIKPLIEELKFLQDKENWKYTLRHGLIGISKEDFDLLNQALTNSAY